MRFPPAATQMSANHDDTATPVPPTRSGTPVQIVYGLLPVAAMGAPPATMPPRPTTPVAARRLAARRSPTIQLPTPRTSTPGKIAAAIAAARRVADTGGVGSPSSSARTGLAVVVAISAMASAREHSIAKA